MLVLSAQHHRLNYRTLVAELVANSVVVTTGAEASIAVILRRAHLLMWNSVKVKGSKSRFCCELVSRAARSPSHFVFDCGCWQRDLLVLHSRLEWPEKAVVCIVLGEFNGFRCIREIWGSAVGLSKPSVEVKVSFLIRDVVLWASSRWAFRSWASFEPAVLRTDAPFRSHSAGGRGLSDDVV